MNIIPNIVKAKLHLCASGSILLPLAQKWGLVGVVVCGLSLISTGKVSAAEPSLSLTLPSTLSLSADVDGILHTVESGKLSVTSNTYWGYELSINSSSTDGALVSGNNKLQSIAAATSESGFDMNAWGFKFSGGTIGNNYQPGPKNNTPIILDKTTGTSESKDYKVTLAAKVNKEQAAGTYVGNFTFTVTANAATYTINYNNNGGSGGPAQDKSQTQGQTVQLSATVPTRSDYGFAGWCTSATSNEICNGLIYQPGDIYTLSSSTDTLNLYAVWAKTNEMQNWDGCKNLKQHQMAYLKDTRDNNEYKVAKLKDSKCWMIENLRLGSNIETGGTLQLDDKTSDIASGSFTLKMTPANFNYNGDRNVDAAYIDNNYGGYYSWNTATAGTGATIDHDKTHDASNSICPKGWKLPTGGPSGELKTMTDLYSGSKMLSSPIPHLILAGLVVNTGGQGLLLVNNEGSLWSSTGIDNDNAYRLLFKESAYQDFQDKQYGLSVRCIARE